MWKCVRGTDGVDPTPMTRIEDCDRFWPGGDPGEKAYNDESGLNASELIWSFFSRLGDDLSWNDIPLTTPE